MSHDMKVTSNRHTSGQKIKTTIRVDGELWRKFRWDLRSKHLRTCSVLEAMMTAYLYGGATVPGLGRPQNVNITIKREINVPDSRKGVEARMEKKDGRNHYDPHHGWYYDPDLDPGEIVVEQPRRWKGEEKGFIWVRSRKLWWKKEP